MAWADLRARGASGNGTLRSVTGTDRAANTEITETVPAGKVWRIQAFKATIVCDAQAANRSVHLIYDDGTNILWGATALSTGIATGGYIVTGAIGAPYQTSTSVQNYSSIPLPDIPLGPGCRITTLTTNMQTGDNWGAPILYVVAYDA